VLAANALQSDEAVTAKRLHESPRSTRALGTTDVLVNPTSEPGHVATGDAEKGQNWKLPKWPWNGRVQAWRLSLGKQRAIGRRVLSKSAAIVAQGRRASTGKNGRRSLK
jgi:hypothetical protein